KTISASTSFTSSAIFRRTSSRTADLSIWTVSTESLLFHKIRRMSGGGFFFLRTFLAIYRRVDEITAFVENAANIFYINGVFSATFRALCINSVIIQRDIDYDVFSE